jgi:hypothetical protein
MSLAMLEEAEDPHALRDDDEAAATISEAAWQRALEAELDRRVAELAATSDGAFGRMGWGDALAVIAFCLVAPALAVWIFR